jgi:hypothetical protein
MSISDNQKEHVNLNLLIVYSSYFIPNDTITEFIKIIKDLMLVLRKQMNVDYNIHI